MCVINCVDRSKAIAGQYILYCLLPGNVCFDL